MAKNVRVATLSELQAHERLTAANVRIGSYGMELHCPSDRFQIFRIELESTDLARIFLLWEPTFIPHTKKRSCKLADITSTAEGMSMERRVPGEVNAVDLTQNSKMEPVLVTNHLNDGPLITIDGNHRLTAHYARTNSIDGVWVYVGVHCNILDWNFIPPLAKCTNKK